MTIQEFIKTHGLQMDAQPIPANPNMDDMPKGSRHFSVTIRGRSGDNRSTLTTPYSVGPGIVEHWLKQAKPVLPMLSDQRLAFLTGKATHYAQEYVDAAAPRYPGPELADVLDCLASDAQGVVCSPLFEDWAGDYGYDIDSRKAEATFKTITEQRHKLERLLGHEAFETLLNDVERL